MGNLQDAIAEALREEYPNTMCDGYEDDAAGVVLEVVTARQNDEAAARPAGSTPELDKLYKACREIEDTEGGWNAGDVVDIVTGLLTAHGYDLTPIAWCEQCQETPAAADSKLCEGCAEDDEDDEAPDMECPECGAPAGKPCDQRCIVDQNKPAGAEAAG